MQDVVRRYSDELRRGQGVEVQIRVGVKSGDVVVRAIGSDLRMDYTAVGQTTHLAARIARSREEFAAGRTISMGEMKREVLPQTVAEQAPAAGGTQGARAAGTQRSAHNASHES